MDILIVKKIENLQDSSDQSVNFKKVTFQVQKFFNGVRLKSNQPLRTRNLWAERKLENGNVIKADPLFSDIEVGDMVEGRVDTLTTTDYTLNGRTVNSITTVSFDNENPLTVALRSLKQHPGVGVVDDATGEIHLPKVDTAQKAGAQL
jgi:hypothetical protein